MTREDTAEMKTPRQLRKRMDEEVACQRGIRRSNLAKFSKKQNLISDFDNMEGLGVGISDESTQSVQNCSQVQTKITKISELKATIEKTDDEYRKLGKNCEKNANELYKLSKKLSQSRRFLASFTQLKDGFTTSLNDGSFSLRGKAFSRHNGRYMVRLENYDTFETCVAAEQGDKGTFNWRLHFKSTALEDEGNMSCWHDIPLVVNKTGVFNYVNEIPKGDLAKMECATKERWNPIKQDVKKGKLRFFSYGPIPFNYGFLPQTWEDPTKRSTFSDSATMGDNDPIDVVELSDMPLSCGQISSVKVLGCLGLIDEGETD